MSHDLTQSQLANIATQLQSERKALLEQIRDQLHGESEHAQRLDRLTQLKDPGDYSVADVLQDMQLELLDRETEHLRAIEDAEVRIQKGTYGQCIDCGTRIAAERLLAQPTATRCMDCQEIYERNHPGRVTTNL
jgi:DnaK suppressor protein